ncbi:MAG: hypothetical protein LUC93_12590 [Planctomycetaceae bacterium]|nr:hypothetical protein [Planctomycetaceae bacterium]
MSTVGMRSLTLADYAKRLGPDKQIGKVMEILEQSNEVLDDAMFLEANNVTTHRTVIRTGLPESYWRTLNRGVPKSKSNTTQIDDQIGMLETWSVVDSALAELNGQQADFLLSEERAFLESMNQEVAKTIFYGDLASNAAAFSGLSSRFCTLDPTIGSSANIIDAGGTGPNCTSAWLCVWGDLSLHMIYPKGTTSGLRREFLGRCPVVDENANEFMGYKTNYSWSLGLCLRDWRYVVRIANIDTAQLDALMNGGAAEASGNALIRCMIKAHNLIPNIRLGRPAWYMNRSVKTLLDLMAAEKSNVNLTMANFAGESVTAFKGVPIRQVDALVNNESAIVK